MQCQSSGADDWQLTGSELAVGFMNVSFGVLALDSEPVDPHPSRKRMRKVRVDPRGPAA